MFQYALDHLTGIHIQTPSGLSRKQAQGVAQDLWSRWKKYGEAPPLVVLDRVSCTLLRMPSPYKDVLLNAVCRLRTDPDYARREQERAKEGLEAAQAPPQCPQVRAVVLREPRGSTEGCCGACCAQAVCAPDLPWAELHAECALGVWRNAPRVSYQAELGRQVDDPHVVPDEVFARAHQRVCEILTHVWAMRDKLEAAAENVNALLDQVRHDRGLYIGPPTPTTRQRVLQRLDTIQHQAMDTLVRKAFAPSSVDDARRHPVRIREVPKAVQADAGTAYYDPQEGVFYINPSLYPHLTWHELPALLVHEAVPGHHHQQRQAPRASSLAFIEGWGLYVEQLAKEHGLYDDDPWKELGYWQYLLLRALRMVVDVGLHQYKWPRGRAIDYVMGHSALSRIATAEEVDRIAVLPGQAATYITGLDHIVRQRARALEAGMDLPAFHDTVLRAAPRKLTDVDEAVTRWIRRRRG